MIDDKGRNCTRCGEWKPWTEYHRSHIGPNGRCCQCKVCRRENSYQYRTNIDEVRERLDAIYEEKDALLEQGLKRCSSCREIKPLDDFTFDKRKADGRQSACRTCYYDKTRSAKYKEKLWLREHGLKRCSRCKKVRAFTEFYENRHMQDGLQSRCKVCIRAIRSPDTVQRERLRKMGLKECIVCHQILVFSAFNRFVRSADGRTSYCRQCSKDLGRIWAQNNPLKVRIQARIRHARKNDVPGTFDEEDIHTLYKKQRGECIYSEDDPECVGDLAEGFHIDHIIPISRTELNPTNHMENLQLLCPHCNLAKGNKTHQEFLTWLNTTR